MDSLNLNSTTQNILKESNEHNLEKEAYKKKKTPDETWCKASGATYQIKENKHIGEP